MKMSCPPRLWASTQAVPALSALANSYLSFRPKFKCPFAQEAFLDAPFPLQTILSVSPRPPQLMSLFVSALIAWIQCLTWKGQDTLIVCITIGPCAQGPIPNLLNHKE